MRTQIESGVVYGISGALWGEVTLKNGRIEQLANAIFAATGKRLRKLPLQPGLALVAR